MPAGMLALDVARIEAGLMLIDVDYVPARKALIDSQTSSPFELDLGWTVNLKKERFVGREALAAEAAREPQWRFVGIEIDWDSLERLYAEVGLATRLPPHGLAHERADLRRAPSRPATPRAAAGRRCSRSTSRSRTCARPMSRPAPSSRWRSPSSTGASAPRRAW